MSDIQTLMGDHDLVVTVEPASENPDMPNPPPGATHWSVVIDGGNMPVPFVVSLLREGGDESPPTAREAITLLAYDLRHAHLGSSDATWLKAHGIPDGGEAAESWLRARDAIVELRQAVAEHLPPEVVRALLGGEAPAGVPTSDGGHGDDDAPGQEPDGPGIPGA